MNRPTALLAVASLIIVSGLAGLATRPETSEVLAVPATVGSGSSATSLVPGAPLASAAGNPRDPTHKPPDGTPRLSGTRVTRQVESAHPAAIYNASATWCAPTKTQCQSWGPPAKLGAVFGFRWGDEPYLARVWHGQDWVDVLIVSFCQCGGTHNAIDLSPSAFADLVEPGREPDDYSSLSLGRIDVLVEVPVQGARVTAPPTSIEGSE